MSDICVSGYRNRGAIAPQQPIAQGKGIGQLVVADLPAFQHLRVIFAPAVDSDELIENEVGKNPGRVNRRRDRIEDRQFGIEHGAHDLFGLRRKAGKAKQQHRERQFRKGCAVLWRTSNGRFRCGFIPWARRRPSGDCLDQICQHAVIDDRQEADRLAHLSRLRGDRFKRTS
jgi:hypothetical protein